LIQFGVRSMSRVFLPGLPALIVCLLPGCGGGGEEATPELAPPPAVSTPATKPAPAVVKSRGKYDDREDRDERDEAPSKSSVATTPAAEDQSSMGSAGNLIAAAVGVLAAAQSPTTLPPTIEQWSPPHFELAARRRNSKLPAAIKLQATEGPPAMFVAQMQRLLEVGAEPAEVPTAQQASLTPGRNVRKQPDRDDRPRFNLKFNDEEDDDRRRGGNRRSEEKKAINAPATPAVPVAQPSPGDGELSEQALTRGIVSGLLMNDSEEAWNLLRAILAGTQTTPLDSKQSSLVVFEGMLGSPNISPVMIESLAVSVVNSSGAGQSAQTILAALGVHALRDELHLPTEVSDGQAAMSGTPALNAGDRPSLLGQGFTGLGRRSREDRDADDNRHARNKPADAKATQQDNKLPKVNVPQLSRKNLLSAIRGQELQKAVNDKLGMMNIVGGDLSLLRFASTIPSVDMREAIYSLYEKQYATGATAIVNSGLFDTHSVDPGHLVVLKSLPRSASRTSSQRSGGRTGRQTNFAPAAAAGFGVEDSWTEATWQVANRLRQQLRQVSANPQLELRGRMPIRLHRGAEAEVAIQFTIEDGSQGTEESPVNTQVYYSRCHVANLPRTELGKIAKHYESKTKGLRRERPDDGILWFDGVRAGRDGTRASLDVMIERSAGPVGGGFAGLSAGRRERQDRGAAGSGAGYTVEAIAVVVTDPQVTVSTADSGNSQPDSL